MKRIIITVSFLLSALMLVQLCACTQETPADTVTDTHAETSVVSDTQTETEETNATDHTEITETDGVADVLLPSGISYTATGYESAGSGIFRIKTGFEAKLKESIKETFNRITFKYSASENFKLYVSYIQNKKEKTDMFYVEASPDGSFSCLISSYLDGGQASELTSFKADMCKGEEADFLIEDIKVEDFDLIKNSTYYLENDRFKVGIKLGWGGGINYVEDKKSTVKGLSNLVNSHDTGRLVQQSYYGTAGNDEYEPGTSFDVRWVYNPVQGGDQYGNASRLIDLKITDNSVYIKAQPQDWSLNGKITPSYMENTYTVTDEYIRVDNRFVDFSGWEHRYSHQELPAFYTVSYLSRFTWYNGTDSWTDDTLSYRDDLQFWGDARYAESCRFYVKEENTETWCSWTSPQTGFGIGIFVPNVDMLYAGKFSYNGSKDPANGATNYVAPLNMLKMVSFDPIEYSYLITTGTVEQIRAAFKANKDFADNASLHKNYISMRTADIDYESLTFGSASSISVFADLYNTEASYSESEKAAVLTVTAPNDPQAMIDYNRAGKTYNAEDYQTIEITYMIPTSNSRSTYETDLFLCTGSKTAPDGSERTRVTLIADGEYHTVTVNAGSLPFWKGKINKIRFDYFDACAKGDLIYVKSFVLK